MNAFVHRVSGPSIGAAYVSTDRRGPIEAASSVGPRSAAARAMVRLAAAGTGTCLVLIALAAVADRIG